MLNKITYIILFFSGILISQHIPAGAFSITRIQYEGGGDWYSDPSSLPNLLKFVENETLIKLNPKEKRAKIGDDIFSESVYLYLTGHGNISFTNDEAFTLRNHLKAGAFLHADDNYGMDKSFRREMKKSFPEKDGFLMAKRNRPLGQGGLQFNKTPTEVTYINRKKIKKIPYL